MAGHWCKNIWFFESVDSHTNLLFSLSGNYSTVTDIYMYKVEGSGNNTKA